MRNTMLSCFEGNKAVNKNVVIPESRNRGSSTHLSLRNETTNDKRGRFPSPSRTGNLGNDVYLMSRCFDGGGFTLIELLVVVLIIGILAAVAVPQYQKAVIKSRLATIRPILASIKQAEEAYYMTNGEYADQWDVLSLDLSQCQQQYRDVVKCGNFMIDLLEDTTAKVYAVYCPNYVPAEGYAGWNSCVVARELMYTVWFTHSEYPDKIECTGKTALGQKVCRTLNF